MNLPDINLTQLTQLIDNMETAANRRYKGKTALATFLRGGLPQNGYIDGELQGKNKIVYGMEDPSYLAFQFIVSTADGLFKKIPSEHEGYENLVEYNKHDYTYSALQYLDVCEAARSKYYNPDDGREETRGSFITDAKVNLEKFIDGFKKICDDYPYYFQTIEGLQDVYKKYYDISKDPYTGGNDTFIKINCLESLDLRMTMLFDSYFRAMYDRKYRRMILPNNIMQFDCTIIVHDLRRFVCSDSHDYDTHITNWSDIEQNTSMIIFRFKNCIFSPDAVGETFAGVSNAESTATKFSFQFKYDDVNIEMCSLADVLEDPKNASKMKEYRDVTDQNIYTAGHIDHTNRPITEGDMGYKNVYEGETGRGLFGALFNAGRQIFGSATSSSSMGNVYSDGAVGYLDNMFNSIGVGGFGSFVKGEGKQAMRDLGERMFGGTNDRGERTFMNKLTNGGHFTI